MPRSKRADEAGAIYHTLNRGNAKRKIFRKPSDYEAFIRTLKEGLEKYPVDLLAFCLMPNHWHMVVRPTKDGAMGRLIGWVSATHTLRHHAHHHTAGSGHLYQGPFKSFPVADDEHFFIVCRYVERNALRAKLCTKAEDWRFGSLHRWHHNCDKDPKVLTTWPIRRLGRWTERVNTPLTKGEIDAVRTSLRRNRPFGSQEWIEQTCDRTGLWSTLRPRGRPTKRRKPEAVQPNPK